MEIQYKYKLSVIPKPTPRPRLGRYGTYNKKEYTKYKNDLMILIKSLRIPKKDYSLVRACFLFPYPKRTPQKKRIHLAPLRNKCDLDNLVKGLLDALEKVEVINNDRQIFSLQIEKRFTVREQGAILFDFGNNVDK
tara:strand:- start:816 stop:1223 length:408 start_codon:yes stop_codon:yes gene_type:complete